jgi:hypothetical protein
MRCPLLIFSSDSAFAVSFTPLQRLLSGRFVNIDNLTFHIYDIDIHIHIISQTISKINTEIRQNFTFHFSNFAPSVPDSIWLKQHTFTKKRRAASLSPDRETALQKHKIAVFLG